MGVNYILRTVEREHRKKLNRSDNPCVTQPHSTVQVRNDKDQQDTGLHGKVVNS